MDFRPGKRIRLKVHQTSTKSDKRSAKKTVPRDVERIPKKPKKRH